jgi:hypothetical protein
MLSYGRFFFDLIDSIKSITHDCDQHVQEMNNKNKIGEDKVSPEDVIH